MKRILLISGVGVAVLAGVGSYAYAEKFGLEAQAKARMGLETRDPLAVQFDSLESCNVEADTDLVAGYMNAKNAFGAYTGRVKFAAVRYNATPVAAVWPEANDWSVYIEGLRTLGSDDGGFASYYFMKRDEGLSCKDAALATYEVTT